MLASIDELSIDNKSDDVSIGTNGIKDIRYGNQIHTDINARDVRLKICDYIKQTKNECKVEELSANSMVKGLHKFFKAVVNELNNALPNLV